MTWRHVWRRDLLSSYRSRLVPAVAVLLVLGTAGLALTVYALDNFGPPPGMRTAVVVLGGAAHVLVPLVALLSSYSALVGERESGSVRFLLGLPNSRRDAYGGKLGARLTAVGAPLAAGLLVATVAVGALFQDGSYVGMLWLTAVTLVYALVFVGVGLALSAVASTGTRAVVGAVGVFALLRGGWPALQLGLLEFTGSETFPLFPEWYYWLGRVNPINAYLKLTTASADLGRRGHPLLSRTTDVEFQPGSEERVVTALDSVAVTGEFAAVVLLAWAVVVPVLGLLAWERSDLL